MIIPNSDLIVWSNNYTGRPACNRRLLLADIFVVAQVTVTDIAAVLDIVLEVLEVQVVQACLVRQVRQVRQVYLHIRLVQVVQAFLHFPLVRVYLKIV